MKLKILIFVFFAFSNLKQTIFANTQKRTCSDSILTTVLNETKNRPALFFHDRCPDGFTCAWIFHLKFKDEIKYFPMSHYKNPPELEKGIKIYMADFSFPRDIILKLKKNHPYVKIIDHHDTARSDLEDLDNVIFDSEKSGARLTWEYWFPDKVPPKIVLYTENKDLWKWELPYSKEINSYIATQKMNFDNWYKLNEELENSESFERIKMIGVSLVEQEKRYIDRILNISRLLEFEEYKVPIVNTSIFQSEVGHGLLEKYPEAKFSMTYFIDENQNVEISLRAEDKIHVGNIAKIYGGGGHKNAAGYRMRFDDFKVLLLSGEFSK